MRSPMGFATLILLLVVLPVFFIDGRERLVLRAACPLVRARGAGVDAGRADRHAGARASMLLVEPGAEAARVAARCGGQDRRYGAALSRVVAQAALACWPPRRSPLLAGLAVIPALDGPVIPAFKDRNLVVHLDGPPGTSRAEMSRIMARASRDLRSVPGVSDVAGHVGRAVTGDQVVDVNSSELWVKVASDADYDATKASIDDVLKDYAGLNRYVADLREAEDPGRRRRGRQAGRGTWRASSSDLDVLTGADRRPLVVRVYGENLAILRAAGAHG